MKPITTIDLGTSGGHLLLDVARMVSSPSTTNLSLDELAALLSGADVTLGGSVLADSTTEILEASAKIARALEAHEPKIKGVILHMCVAPESLRYGLISKMEAPLRQILGHGVEIVNCVSQDTHLPAEAFRISFLACG